MEHSYVRLKAVVPATLLSLFAGVAAVAGSYATAGFTPEFVVAPVTGTLSRSMPDVVVRYAITVLGSLGQQLNLLTGIAIVVAVVGSIAGLSTVLGRELDNRALPIVVTTVGTWAISVALTGSVVLSFGAAVPAGLVLLVATAVRSLPGGPGVHTARREVLAGGLSALAVGATGAVLGSRRTPERGALDGDDGEAADATDSRQSERRELLATASANAFDLAGAEPLVSEDFYEVDINAVDPTVEASDWTLSVTGAVDSEVTVDYDELRGMDAVDRFETLRCVGEELNGHKMDTALWTGVPVSDLLERATHRSDCECVMLRAADDYYEEFPLEALDDAIIAYGMNDEVLPRGHGYPARVLVPGHWGEINVKWVTEIELLDEKAEGYWEERGWHGTGPVETVAKLHAVNDLADGRTELGGHAYAGTRGIDSVEVSTDGGSTWEPAELTDPLPGIDVWRQWRFIYDPPDGRHDVVVRATDATGTLQPREESDAFPSGPTGWVSRTRS